MTGKILRNWPRSSSSSDTRPSFSPSSRVTSRSVCVARFLATRSYVRMSFATRAARRTSLQSTSGSCFENSLTSFCSSLSLRCTDHIFISKASEYPENGCPARAKRTKGSLDQGPVIQVPVFNLGAEPVDEAQSRHCHIDGSRSSCYAVGATLQRARVQGFIRSSLRTP